MALLVAGPIVAAPPPVQAAAATTAAPDSWETVASLLTPRLGLAATAGWGSDKSVYAFGGSLTSNGKSGEVYDPVSRSWSHLPPMAVARIDMAAAAGSDGRIYVIGGYTLTGFNVLNVVEAYDPVTKTWETVAPISVPRSGLAAATDAQGRIYAIGGNTPLLTAAVEMFDPSSPAPVWTPVTPMSVARTGHGAALGGDGRIYVVGAAGATSEAYAPDLDAWSPVPPLPTARSAFGTATGPDGRVYVIGGTTCENCGYGRMATVEFFDPPTGIWGTGTGTWGTGRDMPTARENLAAAPGPDGRIWAMGGIGKNSPTDNDVIFDKVEAFAPPVGVVVPPQPTPVPPGEEGSWQPAAPMATYRYYTFGATRGMAPDNRLYVVGGNGTSAEVYDPAANRWTALPPMTVSRHQSAAATGSDGRIYAIGGSDLLNPHIAATVEAYDPDTEKWDLVAAPLRYPRTAAAAVTGLDGRIYVMGGASSTYVYGAPSANPTFNTVEAYDPADPDAGWVEVAPMIHPRSNFGATVGSDGRIYAVGGAGNSAEAYNPADPTAGWVEVAPMPSERGHVAAATDPDGLIYAIGGGSEGTNEAFGTVDVYEPDTNRWAPATPMNIGRRRPGAVTGPDGRIYAIGGEPDTWKSVEVYTPGPMPPAGAEVKPIVPVVTGAVSEYRTTDRDPISITVGPDGNLWATFADSIGRMTPEGRLTYFPMDARSNYSDITVGPDDNLWFVRSDVASIGRMNPDTGEVRYFPLPAIFTSVSFSLSGGGAHSIAAGADGNLWFTHPGSKRIGRITPQGAVTDFLITSTDIPLDITAGPDGHLWFIEQGGLARITTEGVITEYRLGYGLNALTAGPDGKVWFTEGQGDFSSVGKLDPEAENPAATVVRYPVRNGAKRIASGPDGNLWATGGYQDYNQPENDAMLRINLTAGNPTISVFPLSKMPGSEALNGAMTTAVLGDVAADPAGPPYVGFTESNPGGLGRVDMSGEPAYSYTPGTAPDAPGENCRSTGDPAANYQKTFTVSCTIASDGPLTHISISRDLNCQVYHEMDTHSEHYTNAGKMPAGRGGDGECGTFLVSNGTLYGPNTVPCYYVNLEPDGCGGKIAPDKAFELIEQRGVFGNGTIEHPYAIVTELQAGDLRLTQTDSYVLGRESYRTDVKVTNTTAQPATALLTKAADCWLANSDSGGGTYEPTTGSPTCTGDYTAETATFRSRILQWTPLSPDSHWTVGNRSRMWDFVGEKKGFPDRCAASESSCGGENGAGLNWEFNLDPGESTIRSHYTTFSPFGNTAASIGDARVTEPAPGEVAAQATFEVKLENRAGRKVTLDYTAVDGSATAASDYEATTGQVVFEPGETVKTATVPVLADRDSESAEDFHVMLSNPDEKKKYLESPVDSPFENFNLLPPIDPDNPDPNARYENAQNVILLDADGVGTIDDHPFATLSVGDAGEVMEPATATATATASFTVRREGDPTKAVTVHYATADGGTAEAGVDYEAAEGILEFAPDELTKEIAVVVRADAQAGEPTEDFFVELSDSPNAALGQFRARGTIADPAVELSVNDPSVVESRSATVSAIFTVSLAAPTSQATTFNYATADGTATAPADYTAIAGRLEIPAGQTSITIDVPVMSDTKAEDPEEFSVTLSNPVGATLGKGRGTATVLDAGPAPGALSIGDISVDEGDSGTRPAVFTVTLDDAHTDVVTVDYATADATATAGADYRPATGTLTFTPGETTRSVRVEVVGDTAVEATERFTVALTNAAGAPVARGEGTGTIVDNDVAPAVVDEPRRAAEPPPVRTSNPTTEVSGDPVVDLPITPPVVVAPLLVLTPPPPVPAPPQPITQPVSQAQGQQQPQQQNQQQNQQQQQQQAQQQAQSQSQAQGQAQAQGQVQAQAGMAAERQNETQVERATIQGGPQQYLASARETSPVQPAAVAWAASVIGLGIALVWPRGEKTPVQELVPRRNRSGSRASRRSRR